MKKNTTLKVVNVVTTALLFILLVSTAFLVISTKAAGGEPNLFGYQLKMVLSGSMEPEIQTGSVIAIKPSSDETHYKKGDVITFEAEDGKLITHRIVQIKGDGEQYITKGDNNNGPDVDPVLSQNIVGKYTGFAVPYVGYVIHFANSKQGAVWMFIVPGIMLVGYSIITVWRALRKLDATDETKINDM